MSKGFDFGAMDPAKLADEPQEMELVSPVDGSGIGVFLTVRGAEGATFRQLARKETNAARKRAFEQERLGKKAHVRTLEEDEEAGIKLTTGLVVAWRTGTKPVINDGGQELECTPENVAAWLRKYSWVIPQITEFAGEIQNFTKGSSKASPPSPPITSS